VVAPGAVGAAGGAVAVLDDAVVDVDVDVDVDA
jgi:hypothetical protein